MQVSLGFASCTSLLLLENSPLQQGQQRGKWCHNTQVNQIGCNFEQNVKPLVEIACEIVFFSVKERKTMSVFCHQIIWGSF